MVVEKFAAEFYRLEDAGAPIPTTPFIYSVSIIHSRQHCKSLSKLSFRHGTGITCRCVALRAEVQSSNGISVSTICRLCSRHIAWIAMPSLTHCIATGMINAQLNGFGFDTKLHADTAKVTNSLSCNPDSTTTPIRTPHANDPHTIVGRFGDRCKSLRAL